MLDLILTQDEFSSAISVEVDEAELEKELAELLEQDKPDPTKIEASQAKTNDLSVDRTTVVSCTNEPKSPEPSLAS